MHRFFAFLVVIAVTAIALECSAQRVYDRIPTSDTYRNFVRGSDRPQVSKYETLSRDLNLGTGTRPYTRATFGLDSRGVGGRPSGRVTKPFSYVTQAPTVSPYLNLFRENLSEDSAPNYQTLVRPQMRQLDFQRQQQMRNQQVHRQIQGLQQQSAYSPQGSRSIMPTGHGTIFGYTSRFYPSRGGARRRR